MNAGGKKGWTCGKEGRGELNALVRVKERVCVCVCAHFLTTGGKRLLSITSTLEKHRDNLIRHAMFLVSFFTCDCNSWVPGFLRSRPWPENPTTQVTTSLYSTAYSLPTHFFGLELKKNRQSIPCSCYN